MGARAGHHFATPEDALRRMFGYTQFRGDQARVIAAVVEGASALAVMPTGGGKSLCFQIPALLRPGVGLVVSPLVALMRDQVDDLTRRGFAAATLNATLPLPDQRRITQQLRDGALDLLYVAPERLMQPDTRALLQTIPLALIAIDEAHCLSEWGHDFRPDYLMLANLARTFPGVPRLALTATADARTRAEIADKLAISADHIYLGGFDRPNIRLTVQPKSTSPMTQLTAFLNQQPREAAGIIYCQSRARVEAVADALGRTGRTALPYHAGLPADVREANQARFLADEGVLMVATIAFGMGINKPDVRFVVHLDLPKSIEAYAQESGRAGRDGAPADALLLFGTSDISQIRRWIDESDGSEAHKHRQRDRLNALLTYCEATGCRRQRLLAAFDEALTAPCGNCDRCLKPVAVQDATVLAQKLLSAVYKTGESFGGGHLIDVLRGKTTEKITRFSHHTLSVFGIGKDVENSQWQALIRTLIAAGHLQVDPTYQGLRFSASSRAVMKGEIPISLVAPTKAERAPRGAKPARGDRAAAPTDDALYETLRQWRAETARAEKVPAYVVFQDAVLQALAARKPTTPTALITVPGIGDAKARRYGARVLAVIADSKRLG